MVFILTVCNSTVLFSRPKVACAPKTAAHINHLTNILNDKKYSRNSFGTNKAKYSVKNNKTVTECQILNS